MSHRRSKLWIAATLGGAAALGCAPGKEARPYPADPLLLSHHPVEGNFAPSPTRDQVTFKEPKGVVAPDVLTTPQPAAADSTIRQAKAETPRASGVYRHSPDYRTLYGTIDKRSHGPVYLRYADLADPDVHGGKFLLENDSRLDSYRDGDIVAVEGMMLADSDERPRGLFNPYPTYHVRDIRLLERP